ncbi:MAG: hypothetical protein K9J30_04485 [Bacteroidales bacterium]|nr:hypothetical protein [Bacteroidales bacterium]
MDSPATFRFSFEELDITFEIIRDMMGSTGTEAEPDPMTESIHEAMKMAPEQCNIRGGYIIENDIRLDAGSNRLYCHDMWFDTGQVVTRQLNGSEKTAVFLCTAGEKISAYANRLMSQGEFMKGYAIDVLANKVVDKSIDKIQGQLQNVMAERGLKITNRYSPGYCDWDITEQKKLFSIFPDRFLEMSLTDSYLMVPVKSVSGMIGIGKDVRCYNNTCNFCNLTSCLYRNRGKN